MLGVHTNKLDVWVDFYVYRNPTTGSMSGYGAQKLAVNGCIYGVRLTRPTVFAKMRIAGWRLLLLMGKTKAIFDCPLIT